MSDWPPHVDLARNTKEVPPLYRTYKGNMWSFGARAPSVEWRLCVLVATGKKTMGEVKIIGPEAIRLCNQEI